MKKTIECMYHYSPRPLQQGEKLETGSWLTNRKGCAISEKIAQDPTLTLYEHLVIVNMAFVQARKGHKRTETQWYTVATPEAATVSSVRPTNYQEMKEHQQNAYSMMY